MAQFALGDVVQVTNKYPSDKDYPYPYAYTENTQLWGLQGVVVASEFGYIDEKYVFVQPLGGLTFDWPRKQRFDPESFWHFLPEELKKVHG
jgi:hypothetical protein